MNSDDNKRKFVPCTSRVALMKLATGFIGSAPAISIGGFTLTKPSDVEDSDLSSLESDQQDIVADWLTLFYQEDPKADYKKKSFLQLSSEYGEMLDNLPSSTYPLLSEDGVADIQASLQVNHESWRKVKIWRWIAGIFGFLPLLAMIVIGVYLTVEMGALDFSGSLIKAGYWVGLGIGGIVFLCMLGEDYGFIIAGIAGLICFALIKLAFAFLGTIVPWLVLGLMLLALIFLGKKVFFGAKNEINDEYTDLDWDEAVDRYFVGIRFDCLEKDFPANVPDVARGVYCNSKKNLRKVNLSKK